MMEMRQEADYVNHHIQKIVAFFSSMRAFAAQLEQSLQSYWADFRCWALGHTGNSLIDSIMQELFFTGEISNRARQCAASYLIHDLHIPWWWGAQWFESHLLDYDVSSNWGNWAYIAGVGADARPVRKFNIAKQAGTYDPHFSYRDWINSQEWHIPDDVLSHEFPPENYRFIQSHRCTRDS